MKKYRIVKRTDGYGRTRFFVEKYTRLWYAPWKFAWVDAISWECCGYGVPWFNSFGEALSWIHNQITPIKEEVVYDSETDKAYTKSNYKNKKRKTK